jgi:hypothetical protein
LYNGQYYWPGQTQFYRYDGIVNRQENNMSTDYFFNNINRQYQSRVYSESNRRNGEIWTHYPTGNSTECNSVLIYNVDLSVYYDVQALFRTASYEASALLPYPLMADANTEQNLSSPPPPGTIPDFTYPVWIHEFGLNKQAYNQISAIKSFFRTKLNYLAKGAPDNDYNSRITRIEPDFVMTGTMYMTLYLQAFPSSVPVQSKVYSFTGTTDKIDIDNDKRQARIWSAYFESNEVDGYYQMGRPLVHIEQGDERPAPTDNPD